MKIPLYAEAKKGTASVDGRASIRSQMGRLVGSHRHRGGSLGLGLGRCLDGYVLT